MKSLRSMISVVLFIAAPGQAQAEDTVILLHGIGHSSWNMYAVERAMKKEGFNVVNITYPSLRNNLTSLSKFLHERLNEKKIWENKGKIHFVTHSMGGLVTRRYLETYKSEIPAEKLGRVVMIAPPHGGSEIADLLQNFPPYKWGFGPAGQELTTTARALDNSQPYYDVGIIAGSKKWPYIFANFIIRGDHDGRVTVLKTRLEGMKDHVTLPATHSFISWKPSIHKQITHFIRNGKFQHAE